LSCFLILKKRRGISGAPAKKVSWSFKDVLGTYGKAYFSPMALFVLAFVIAVVCGFDLTILHFGSIFTVPLLFGLLSLVFYWIVSQKRYRIKFRQAYPDAVEETAERPMPMLTLTLWQLLCVGTINLVSVAITYGVAMAIVVARIL